MNSLATQTHARRTAFLLAASATLAALLTLAVSSGMADDQAPVVEPAVPAAGTSSGEAYDPMQDYVDTLIYWHHNPTWYPQD